MPTSTSKAIMPAGRGRKRGRESDVVEPENGAEASPDSTAKKTKKTKVIQVSHPSYGSVPGIPLTLGEGDTGQLGLGEDTMERTKPAVVSSVPDKVTQVRAGGMHTLCLTENGEVFSFGCNDEGALGRSTPDEEECFEAGKVELPEKVVYICGGDSHSAALTELGHVFAWGTFRDANGSIGLNTDGKSQVPTQILKDHVVVKISSGSDHLVLLTETGFVYTLGAAEQGQLGRVAECFAGRGGRKGLGKLLEPGIVHPKKRKTRFSDIWAGQYVTFCKCRDTGDIVAWGLNNYYQLGFDDMENRFMPEVCKAFDPTKNWKQIASGQHHTIALDSEGKVYACGRKEYGRLGMGEENAQEMKVPTLIPALTDKTFSHVATGSAVSFAVTTNGVIYAWGMGSSKQLGNKEEEDLWDPTELTGKQLETRSGVMVSAGGQHTVLLASDKGEAGDS